MKKKKKRTKNKLQQTFWGGCFCLKLLMYFCASSFQSQARACDETVLWMIGEPSQLVYSILSAISYCLGATAVIALDFANWFGMWEDMHLFSINMI